MSKCHAIKALLIAYFCTDQKKNKMDSYSYSFTTAKSPKEVFEFLQDVKQWWSGFYEESFEGSSQQLNHEFTFHAGGGMHITKHRLIESIPYQRIVWEVIESKLSFLENPKEWERTKLVFEISDSGGETRVKFTHEGLEPQIECYDQCSSAWSQYLTQLKEKFQGQ
ncbi:SRPBCC domain-containing protein [Algoriphagus aestuariicola]|uniref:SRPBCC domain-containing protein n=1 Tax=Algoriphagus aestuariicola TaxID=1852016 RepID=A0ABS3BW78_9BACT|nr:SRPBCC domain-containing protein [Algoriphagus aestuariicola]MBN7803560.1 SRPBCC domain-containing protein [Algoriphagus aestuariicola]